MSIPSASPLLSTQTFKIAVTGVKRRNFDQLALTSSGMEIRGHLDSDTKILVASEGSGLSQREDGLANKVQACKADFHIPIVTIEWVYASLSAGRPVEVEAYLATDEYLGMPRANPLSIAEDATSSEPAAAAAAAQIEQPVGEEPATPFEEAEPLVEVEISAQTPSAHPAVSFQVANATPPNGGGASPEGEAVRP